MKGEMSGIAERYYTITQATEQLGVNRITIRRWIKKGKIQVQRVGNVALIERGVIEDLKNERY